MAGACHLPVAQFVGSECSLCGDLPDHSWWQTTTRVFCGGLHGPSFPPLSPAASCVAPWSPPWLITSAPFSLSWPSTEVEQWSNTGSGLMDPSSQGQSHTVVRSIEHEQPADGPDEQRTISHSCQIEHVQRTDGSVEPRTISHSCQIDRTRAAGWWTRLAKDNLTQSDRSNTSSGLMDPSSQGQSHTDVRSIEHGQRVDGPVEPRTISHRCQIDRT